VCGVLKNGLIRLSFIAALLHPLAAVHINGLTLAKDETISYGRAAGAREVKLFLIAVDDAGRLGKKIGCGDSVVAVTRELRPTRTPLRAALEELLRIPRTYGSDPELYNALYQSELKLVSVSVRRGIARLSFAGRLITGGVCDSPRVQAQIEETALQFPTVKKVKVFINGVPLSVYLSERG
jgi:spore germination protein GerM